MKMQQELGLLKAVECLPSTSKALGPSPHSTKKKKQRDYWGLYSAAVFQNFPGLFISSSSLFAACSGPFFHTVASAADNPFTPLLSILTAL